LIGKVPLTANGKIDKKSLPSPNINLSIGPNYVAPRNDIELKLCEIWSEVLGIERIGIRDNFFRLGGNSMVSIQVVSKLRQRLILNVTVKDIFTYKTIEELSQCLNTNNEGNEYVF
jgi:bacitracin synthase 3